MVPGGHDECGCLIGRRSRSLPAPVFDGGHRPMARRPARGESWNIHRGTVGADISVPASSRSRATAYGRLGAVALIAAGGAVLGMSVFAYGTSSAPHVMVIVMENKNFSEVIGQANQPYTNSLASNNGLATSSYSMVTGSLPNYLALVSGSTQNNTDNVTPTQKAFPNTQTLADQLATAGFSSKAYAENLPANPNAAAGQYEVIHFPWLYFPNAQIPVADASSLLPDLNSSSAPDFVWYTPNLTNDEDTGTVQQGDAFLSTLIPQVQATPWYQAGGKIIIEWDESTNDTTGINGTTGGGRIPTIVVSAGLAASPQQDTTPVDPIGILHSIEALYGVPNLSGAADPANGNIDALLDASVAPTTTTTAATTATTVPATTPTTTKTTGPATTPTTTKSTTSASGSVVTMSGSGPTGPIRRSQLLRARLAFTGPGPGIGRARCHRRCSAPAGGGSPLLGPGSSSCRDPGGLRRPTPSPWSPRGLAHHSGPVAARRPVADPTAELAKTAGPFR